MFIKAIFPGSDEAGTYTPHQFLVLYRAAHNMTIHQIDDNIQMMRKLINNLKLENITLNEDGSATISHCPIYSLSEDNTDDKIIEGDFRFDFVTATEMEDLMQRPNETKIGILHAVVNAWLNHANILYENIDKASPKVKIVEVFANPDEEMLIRQLEEETGIAIMNHDA